METDFKTSHVIVYRRSFGKGRSCNYISKHLMLLFITFGLPVLTFLASFQNISCYCLSVYKGALEGIPYKFQNISCYCLSQSER